MKKIYAFLLSGSVLFSAAAEVHELKVSQEKQLKGTELEVKKHTGDANRSKTSFKTGSSFEKLKKGKVLKMRKADEEKTIEGLWIFDLGDYYFKDSYNTTIQGQFTATLDGTELWFENEEGDFLPFVGEYDASKNTVTFTEVMLGTASGYYINQEPFIYNYDTEELDPYTVVGTYMPDYDEIGFEPDNGIAWAAYKDLYTSSFAGFFDIYDLEGAVQEADGSGGTLDEVQEGLWKSVGNATFVDAWITPSYSMGGNQLNPNEYAYKVQLQQNVVDQNIYRLWKPYTTEDFVLYSMNESNYEGQIQFDISDPDHVVVIANKFPAGFKDGNGQFYLSNELGWMINELGGNEYKDILIDMLYGEGEDSVPDTFKDGIVTIHTPMFDFFPSHPVGYGWNNNPYSSLIKFPGAGVDGVTTDMNREPRYVNLQGIQVSDPSNGIFIKIEGNKTSKVIIR